MPWRMAASSTLSPSPSTSKTTPEGSTVTLNVIVLPLPAPKRIIVHDFATEKKPVNKATIIGYGDIGARVARRCLAEGWQLAALTRSPGRVGELQAQGIRALTGDLDTLDAEQMAGWPLAGGTLFWFAPPPAAGLQDSRIARVLASLSRTNLPQRIVLISTTAVYGDAQGQLIDEQAPLQPGTERGQRRLDAEQHLVEACERLAMEYVILRVAGIYGPGRLPLERLARGMAVLTAADSPAANRIHADDLADICFAAAQYRGSHHVFNVSDGHPTTMCDYFCRVARLAGLPEPEQVPRSEAKQRLSPGLLDFLQESKVIANRLMLEELGVRLRYPHLEQGLAAMAGEGEI